MDKTLSALQHLLYIFHKACFYVVLTPGGRYGGSPIGVGWGASTSLYVEPSGKLLTVGKDERPSSNILIWKQEQQTSDTSALWYA